MTTVLIGNCGFTIAPCRPQHRDVVMRNLTHVEGMSLDAMRAGIQWDSDSYPEYLGSLERRGVVPNVASLVGHSSVRKFVLGEDASRRTAADAEIAEMRRLVLEAVRAGDPTRVFKELGESSRRAPAAASSGRRWAASRWAWSSRCGTPTRSKR